MHGCKLNNSHHYHIGIISFIWTLFLSTVVFRQIVGIEQDQFERLLNDPEISSGLDNISIETGESKRGVGGRHRCMSSRDMLLILLVYMRQYVSYRFLSWITGHPTGTLYKYVRAASNVLYTYFNKRLVFPNLNARWQHRREICKAFITVIIDGAEQAVLHPIDTDGS
jgi:hypothetical protein